MQRASSVSSRLLSLRLALNHKTQPPRIATTIFRTLSTGHRPQAHYARPSTSPDPVTDKAPPPRRWPLRRIAKWTAIGIIAYSLVVVIDANRPGSSYPALNPLIFSKYILVDKERLSDTSCILTLRPKELKHVASKPQDSYAQFWADGIWSVEIKQPQLNIARSYTPLPPLPSTEAPGEQTGREQDNYRQGDIRLLIRRDPTGEVSNYLHRVVLGGQLEMRGGHTEFRLPSDVDEVIFLAGGTGIAPALQVAQSLARKSQSVPGKEISMRILWANRHREECTGAVVQKRAKVGIWKSDETVADKIGPPNSLVRQLNAFKDEAAHLSMDTKYFVDEAGVFISQQDIADAIAASSNLQSHPTSTGRKLILLSGPDGFMEYFAGPKRIGVATEVHTLTGGLLSRMDLGAWEVWKL